MRGTLAVRVSRVEPLRHVTTTGVPIGQVRLLPIAPLGVRYSYGFTSRLPRATARALPPELVPAQRELHDPQRLDNRPVVPPPVHVELRPRQARVVVDIRADVRQARNSLEERRAFSRRRDTHKS